MFKINDIIDLEDLCKMGKCNLVGNFPSDKFQVVSRKNIVNLSSKNNITKYTEYTLAQYTIGRLPSYFKILVYINSNQKTIYGEEEYKFENTCILFKQHNKYEIPPLEIAKKYHNIWMEFKISQGWKYGEIENDKEKTSPNLIPFEELLKDELYVEMSREYFSDGTCKYFD